MRRFPSGLSQALTGFRLTLPWRWNRGISTGATRMCFPPISISQSIPRSRCHIHEYQSDSTKDGDIGTGSPSDASLAPENGISDRYSRDVCVARVRIQLLLVVCRATGAFFKTRLPEAQWNDWSALGYVRGPALSFHLSLPDSEEMGLARPAGKLQALAGYPCSTRLARAGGHHISLRLQVQRHRWSRLLDHGGGGDKRRGRAIYLRSDPTESQFC